MATIKELSGLFKGRSKRLEVVHVFGVDTEDAAAVEEVAAEASEVVQQPASEPGASALVTPAAAPVAAPPKVKPPKVSPPKTPEPTPAPPVEEKPSVPRAFRRR